MNLIFIFPQFELDIGVAGSLGHDSDELEARRGMRELGTLVEFGPRLKINLGAGPSNGRWRAELPLRGVFDLSDSAAYRGMTLAPKLVFERHAFDGWTCNTSLSAIIADQRLALASLYPTRQRLTNLMTGRFQTLPRV